MGEFRIELSCDCGNAFIAEMLEREVDKVEIDALDKGAALSRYETFAGSLENTAGKRPVRCTFVKSGYRLDSSEV